MLFLGAIFPHHQFAGAYEFTNARDAWLRHLDGTVHGKAVERFVTEVMETSQAHELPVDDGMFMLLLVGGLEDAKLDQRKLSAALLPATVLAKARCVQRPPRDLVLPEPPAEAGERIARF